MLLFEAFAVIHLGDMEARYNELTKYYELTNYIASEREDFSMLLHNDVLQDIGGAKIFCRFAHQLLMKQKGYYLIWNCE